MAEIKQIVRLISVDVDGGTKTFLALTKIHGISYNFSNAICNYLNLDKYSQIGTLNDDQLKKVEEVIKNPLQHGFPKFMLNRRNDIETGEDRHLIASDLRLRKEFDIKRMKNIRSYKGVRHALGLPV